MAARKTKQTPDLLCSYRILFSVVVVVVVFVVVVVAAAVVVDVVVAEHTLLSIWT